LPISAHGFAAGIQLSSGEMITRDALKQLLLSTSGMRTATGALRRFKAAQLPFLALKALRERCRGFQRRCLLGFNCRL
jgi:hypothetical protein